MSVDLTRIVLALLFLLFSPGLSQPLESVSSQPQHLLFVAILTSIHDDGLRTAVRDTWLEFIVDDERAAHRFFVWHDGDNASPLSLEAQEYGDMELVSLPRTVAEAKATWGKALGMTTNKTFVVIHNGDAVSATLARLYTDKRCTQDYIEVQQATDWPECGDSPCRKGCQVGHLSLAATQYYLRHTSARYLLRLDADGVLCVPSLLEDLSASLAESSQSNLFRAYYYPHYAKSLISCRADENFMVLSRSVSVAVWKIYFGRQPVLSYRHENSFADNAEVAIHLFSSLVDEDHRFVIIDDREKIDSMQGWHLTGRHGHSGQGDPGVQVAAEAACAPLVWIHKVKSGSRLREIWATMQGKKSWTDRGQSSWTPMQAPREFWTKFNGDDRCGDVLRALRSNEPLVEAAHPLIRELFYSAPSDRRKPHLANPQHNYKKKMLLRTAVSGSVIDVDRPIHVMHIPKTAGYSLRSELKKRFSLSIGHTEGE